MVEPWWRRNPGRLRIELKALRAAGFQYEADPKQFEKGRLDLRISLSLEGRTYSVRAVYPETYPYFEPVVYGPDLDFAFHLNPFGKNLCLLGRRTENWWTQWTLAYLLREQFPKIVAANTMPREATRELEFDQGEPLSVFYDTDPGSVVLIDSNWKIPKEIDGGWLRIGLRQLTPSKMLGAVLRVENKNRERLCSLEEAIADKFTQQFWGRWLRVPQFVRENDPDKFDQVISSASHGLASAFWGYRGEPCLDVIGVLFPEEIRRCEFHDGWVFLRRNGKRPGKRKVLPTPQKIGVSLVRAQQCGQTEISSRTPEIAFARNRKVAVVGLGCVGAALALELAKVGIQLVLVDDDEVEFAPAVRWPLGLDYLGWAKSKALADFIGKQWPYCGVQPHIGALGGNRAADAEIITSVDLVVDGTAELGVHRYVGDLAAEWGKPVIEVSSTPGGWGGRLARFLPARDTEPCRVCLWFYEEENYLTIPPADPNGRFQPLGCGDISFHASSADATEISLAGARLVFSTLAEGALGAYPPTWWNVATLWLRSTEGVLIEPKLETWHLTPHPKCRNH